MRTLFFIMMFFTTDLSAVESLSPEENREWFTSHWAHMLSGHVEGVFVVKNGCKIREEPDAKASVVGKLDAGDDVHALSIKRGWMRIGNKKYLSMEDVHPNHHHTPGVRP